MILLLTLALQVIWTVVIFGWVFTQGGISLPTLILPQN